MENCVPYDHVFLVSLIVSSTRFREFSIEKDQEEIENLSFYFVGVMGKSHGH